LLDSPFFIWGVALFGLFKHIPLLPHCGKLSSLLGTSFPSIVRTQRRAYPWWVGGLLLLARSFAIHITSFDRLDLLSHGIRWFGNSGPCLSTVSFSGWLSWANFEHVTGWGSSLLILLVFSAGMAWNLSHLFFACVWTGGLWDRIKSWLRIGRRMFTLNSAIRGLSAQRCNMEFRMRRVSLAITVYLLWEEINKRVFEGKTREVDAVFRRFQILFYTVFYFHETDPFKLRVGWSSQHDGLGISAMCYRHSFADLSSLGRSSLPIVDVSCMVLFCCSWLLVLMPFIFFTCSHGEV